MEEIPVRHKAPVAGLAVVPIWAWVLAALALVGIIGLIVGLRQCGANKTVDNTVIVTPSARCPAAYSTAPGHGAQMASTSSSCAGVLTVRGKSTPQAARYSSGDGSVFLAEKR